ncbi:MAG: sulfotransferase [Bacteroidales bacterium]|nr:sulfotransferase [Bacteroidales bacterium]
MPNKKSGKFDFPISTLVGSPLPNFLHTTSQKKIDKKYRSRYILSLLASAILDPFGRAENFFNKSKIKRHTPAKSPVFIIGYWRSGTTYLHNLLCHDKRFVYVSTYQGIFPNHTLWHQWWLSGIIRLLMPGERPVDHMKLDLNFPQEEEIAMGNLQKLSFYNFFYFPDHFTDYVQKTLHFENTSERDIKKWSESYLKLMAKAAIKTRGERFLSKCPANTFRIEKLVEMFPEARFIYLYRNPYKVLSSFNLFLAEVINGVGFQQFDRKKHLENICELYLHMLQNYERDKHLIKPSNLLELKYEDFITHPLDSIEEIYRVFGIEGFSESTPAFQQHIELHKNHSSSQYNIDPEIKRFVNEKLTQHLTDKGYKILD